MTPDEELELLKQLQDSPELLQRLAGEDCGALRVQKDLREHYSAEIVRAALTLIDARQRAQSIFPNSDQLWLTRVSLEQATHPTVAAWKAAQFPRGEVVYDLCCGMGVDTHALLQRGSVVSIDHHPAALQRCEWNLQQWNPGARLHSWSATLQDAHVFDVTGHLIHIDPDRRSKSDRPAKRLEHYCPNLSCLQQMASQAKGAAIKLGPASNFMQKFPECRIELISLNGECREATVWTGELAGDAPFQATSLPTGETLAGDPLSAWSYVDGQVHDFIFDPDPAIVRSGLLDLLAQEHSLNRLDAADEYLTGDRLAETAFVKSFRVLEVLNNNEKTLRRYLRSVAASAYEIKCRHLKVAADQLRRRLPIGSGPPLVILFARINSKAKIVVAERIPSPRLPA